MDDSIPTGRITRTISSGKVITQLGKNQLKYYLKKPFLSTPKKAGLARRKDRENARIIFDGLSLLRGTALKAAQMLSLESDIIPETVRTELEKSYHQVPPINRALARKIIINNLNAPPEEVFKRFEPTAFAAASLGQVHHAVTHDDETLAVKIQYPDIAATISNDILLLKGVLRPMSRYDVIKAVLNEIETVLLNETDYAREGTNIDFFGQHLDMEQVLIPKIFPDYSTRQVLTMSHMPGTPLNQWMASNPGQEEKNSVAQTLHDIFIKGFYELNTLHADPNPGNFLVTDDLRVSLLDFGCVRKFDDRFIRMYQDLIRISPGSDKNACREMLERMKLVTPDLDPDIADQLIELFVSMGEWFGRLFEHETFDFGANPDFMEQGKQIGMKMHRFRKHIHNITPEFVFLDRTRYGLIRMFEKMKVTIRIKNRYENLDG